MPHPATPSNQTALDEAQTRLLAEGLRDRQDLPPLVRSVADALRKAGPNVSFDSLAVIAIDKVRSSVFGPNGRLPIPASLPLTSLPALTPELFRALQRLREIAEDMDWRASDDEHSAECRDPSGQDAAALALVIAHLDPKGLTLDETGSAADPSDLTEAADTYGAAEMRGDFEKYRAEGGEMGWQEWQSKVLA